MFNPIQEASFEDIRQKFDNHDFEYVIILGRHTCSTLAGELMEAQFTLNAGNEGTPHSCGCFFIVPDTIWNEWAHRYRFMQCLDGKL